jgi:flagellin-like hook-associated protein FlgL
MSITGVGSGTAALVQSLLDLRAQLNDLQTQLGTGKRSDNYADFGLSRGLGVALRSQLSVLGGYGDAITLVDLRLDLAQAALSQVDAMRQAVKTAVLQSQYAFNTDGQTPDQHNALSQLDQMLSALNTQAGDRYLFSGRSVDQPAVETVDRILSGDGVRAGFQQILDERRQADVGVSGLGRLVIPLAVGAIVAVSEDVAGSPFGLKLAGIASTAAGAALAGPAGSPPGASIDLTAASLAAGDTITLSFTLPDGSTENLTLTATNSPAPGAGQFTIGANPPATAANLQAALTAAVTLLADTSLKAASAIAAADDFFNFDAANPPRRVAGPPFDSATGFVSATAANTVFWYNGEAGNDPARFTAAARVDQAMALSYGLRANEEGIRSAVASVAVFASLSFAPTDPNSNARFHSLTQRLGTALSEPAGTQKVTDIAVELAGVQIALDAAKDRHVQTKNTLTDMLQEIEGIAPEEVGAKILALQTRLQASLQTTAMLHQLSLVNYI